MWHPWYLLLILGLTAICLINTVCIQFFAGRLFYEHRAPNNFRYFNFTNGSLQQQTCTVCVHVFTLLFLRLLVDSQNSQKWSPAKICTHKVWHTVTRYVCTSIRMLLTSGWPWRSYGIFIAGHHGLLSILQVMNVYTPCMASHLR